MVRAWNRCRALADTLRFILGHPLARRRKSRAIVRFLRWQVGSRLVGAPVVHEWVAGARFLVSTGETGLTGNIYTGLHEFEDMGFLLHVLRPRDLFVDVGANAGSYTVLACAAAGADGVAFEPVPHVHARLVENVRLNQMEDRVRCINMAVGERPGEVEFTTGRDTVNHALAPGERCGDVVSVAVTTLDSALRGLSPFALKIDVEGYETLVLRGARETLSAAGLHAVIMELNGSGRRYGFDDQTIVDIMAGHGFQAWRYDPWGRALQRIEGKNRTSGNTLFLRGVSRLRARLASAPQRAVLGLRL